MTSREEAARGVFSIDEFCLWANIGRNTFYGEMKSGRLKVRMVGRRRMVAKPDALAWRDNLPVASAMEAA